MIRRAAKVAPSKAVRIVVVALAISGCASIERAALPAPVLLDLHWSAFAAERTETVDHGSWDAFLERYASADAEGVVRVDYGRVVAEDREALDQCLAMLQAIEPKSLTRDQQLAYWINLYNAATVVVVLDAYPVETIRDITDGPLSFGPWDRPVATVSGQALTLNDIEHRIIRPAFREPRIHYALNCAAQSCPNLQPRAWRAEGLDAALEAAERAYVADRRGVTITADGALVMSKIFVWFREDFGADEAAVIERLAAKAPPALAAEMAGRTRVDAYAYDWSLNDAATPTVAAPVTADPATEPAG